MKGKEIITTLLRQIGFNRPEDLVRLTQFLSAAERRGRVLVAGDLHGEYHTLLGALRALNFNDRDDRLILTGDIHDRGKNPELCLDLLRQPWVESVLGNHELMLLETVDGSGVIKKGAMFDMWMENGGEWALQAKPAHLAGWRRLLLERVPLNWVVERRDGQRALICHAESDPGLHGAVSALSQEQLPLSQIRNSPAIWGRRILRVAQDQQAPRSRKRQELRPLDGFRCSVHGHSQLPVAGWVCNQLFIDTGAVFGGHLTLVDLDHVVTGRTTGIYSWNIASERLLGYAARNLFG